MSYVEKNLLPQESIVYRGHLHWIIFIPPAILIILAIGFFAGSIKSGGQSAQPGMTLSLIVLLIGLVMLIGRWIQHATSEFAVTNKRILVKVGLIRRTSLELLLRQIEMIGVEQGLFGRLIGFGTIIVGGTGGTKEPFRQIADPLEFRRQVQGQSTDPLVPAQAPRAAPVDEKICPACAESVKAAARICRYCGHQFV